MKIYLLGYKEWAFFIEIISVILEINTKLIFAKGQ